MTAPVRLRLSRAVWANSLRHPSEAPRDGTYFLGIKRGETRAVKTVWDKDYGCFAQVEDCYQPIGALSAWLPLETANRPICEAV